LLPTLLQSTDMQSFVRTSFKQSQLTKLTRLVYKSNLFPLPPEARILARCQATPAHAAGGSFDLLADPAHNHAAMITGECLVKESSALLKVFSEGEDGFILLLCRKLLGAQATNDTEEMDL